MQALKAEIAGWSRELGFQAAGVSDIDLAEAEATLDELSESGYITKLPRMAGRKEPRYAHLLAGAVESEPEAPKPEAAAIVVRAENERIDALAEEMQQLRHEFQALQAEFEKFRKQFE